MKKIKSEKKNNHLMLVMILVGIVLVGVIVFKFFISQEDNIMSQTQTQDLSSQQVELKTSLGLIRLELYPDKAPITVANFLKYVESNFYESTIFHRVIPGFMIQGGGFTKDMVQKEPLTPIKNEAGNGLSNLRGAIAMARTQIVDSATAQFYINTVDNFFLDHRDNSSEGFGYCVFGKVIEGMEVVDKIQNVPTGTVSYYQDVPKEPVVILSAKIIE